MSKSIKKTKITEIEIEKSRFICTLVPINSNENALKSLEELRKKYSDATHNCYAYILNNGNIQRCSDDGEPSKTAGYPILQALIKNDLDNVLCVVTRYFGGIKLGAGGLVRAYSNSAMESITSAEFVEYFDSIQLEITFDFTYINNLDNLLSRFDLEIIDKNYLDKVTYTINIKENQLIEFKKAIIDLTKNSVLFSEEEQSTINI